MSTDPYSPLTPPLEGVLELTPPEAPKPVPEAAAPRMAPAVTSEQKELLDAKADEFLAKLAQEEVASPGFEAQAAAVRSMGDADIRAAAEQSNRMLQVPVKDLNTGALADGSDVGKTLLELRRTVEALDPSEPTGPKKLLDRVPGRDKTANYFRKYQDSQQQLDAILHALRHGQDELTKDNVALTMEKQQLWATMGRLNQYIYLAQELDDRLTAQIDELHETDPEKADALAKDVLFYVRQKHQDLLTQLAVSIQGYLALDVVMKNNIELIKGVDRASTTTVSALRTAVIVAQAVGNQKLVLDQITALNDTTSGLIERTSSMLKANSAQIQSQAASSTIQLDSLRKAFDNVYQTMDTIDAFRLQALSAMDQTIGVLEGEVQRSRTYLDRASKQPDPSELELGKD